VLRNDFLSHAEELRAGKRLREIVVPRRRRVIAGRGVDNGRCRGETRNEPAEFSTVHPRHGDVGDHQIDRRRLEDDHGVLAVTGANDGIAGAGKDTSHEVADELLIVYDQNHLSWLTTTSVSICDLGHQSSRQPSPR
jgi:hypothetical protein